MMAVEYREKDKIVVRGADVLIYVKLTEKKEYLF
jgi:hypothetical protein